MTYFIVGVLILGAIWLVSYLMGSPQFWHVAAKYPDEAYDWFKKEPGWIVVDPGAPPPVFPSGRSAYAGPFALFVPQLGNSKVQVFGLSDQIEESQERFLGKLREEGRLPSG